MIKLIEGDCLEKMEYIRTETIDLTVTSPPYDNLRDYNGQKPFTFEDSKVVLEKLFRATKKGGVVVWVVSDATIDGCETGTSFKQALWAIECGFNLHDTMIYKRWSGPLNHNRFEQEFEYMFIFSKGKPKTFNPIMVHCKLHKIDSNRTGQNHLVHNEKNRKYRSGKKRNNVKEKMIKSNVWDIKNCSQKGERNGHPAAFPEQLASDHIISWSNENDIVFDPFMGSGTTGKMAMVFKRNFIGIELDPEYFKIATKRIEAADNQTSF